MNFWPKLLIFVVAGYLAMSRSFAYLGLPPAKLFIGEMMIAAFLLFKTREIAGTLLTALGEASLASGFATAFVCFWLYGFFEVIHGLASGYRAILAMQCFAFNYYPVCFFIGLWAGCRYPGLLPRMIRKLAWVNGIYGILYLVFLNKFNFGFPGTTDVMLFGQPAGSAIAVLGLLCVERNLSRVWFPILLNLMVMLGVQVRAEYLGFALGLAVWSLLTRRFSVLIGSYAAIALLLVAGLLVDFRMKAPSTRGGYITTREIVGRVLAPVDLDLAKQLAPQARSLAGTTTWRTKWWLAIWDQVHDNTETAILGEGYGYPIASLVGYKERDIRTPHSVFFYSLAYGGWVGVALFFMLQIALLQLMHFAWRISGIPFGLVLWVAFASGAFFGNAYETPFGAIPFYLMTGLSAAPVLAVVNTYARADSAQLLSTARG